MTEDKHLNFDENLIRQRLEALSPGELAREVASELSRVGQALTEVKARLAALESLMSLSDRILRSNSDAPSSYYPCRFQITAAHSSFCAPEFYALEYGEQGLPVRWTGPDERFTFSFFLNRNGPAKFLLDFERAYYSDSGEGLTCFVDDQEVALLIAQSPSGFTATGILPNRSNFGATALCFICPETRSPSDRGLDDTRKLGVRFRKLLVEAETQRED